MSSPLKYQSRIRNEVDPYSPMIVEDLLHGKNDWRSIPDIVRLTFKALSDVVKTQGAAIKELEMQLPSRATKSELNSALAVKANISEVSRSLTDMRSTLESKTNMNDIYTLLEDKVSRADLQYLIGNKVSYQDLENLLESKADSREVHSEIRALRAILEEVQNDTYKQLKYCASQKDLMYVQSLLDSKVGEVQEQLETKANKESVTNLLQRKANRSEMESILETKADYSEIESLFASLEQKADCSSVELLNSEMQNKADRQEVNKLIAHESSSQRAEVDSLSNTISLTKRELNRRIEDLHSGLSYQLEETQKNFYTELDTKTNYSEFEKLANAVAKKADADNVVKAMENYKEDVHQRLEKLRYSLSLENQNMQSEMNTRYSNLDNYCKMLESNLNSLDKESKETSEQQQKDLSETTSFLKHFYTSKLNEEVQRLKEEIDTNKSQIKEVHNSKSDRTELRKLNEAKIDIKEFEDKVNRTYQELVTQLHNTRDQLSDSLAKKERELQYRINEKSDQGEVKSQFSDFSYSIDRIKSNLEDLKSSEVSKVWDKLALVQKSLESLKSELEQKAYANEVNIWLKEKVSLNKLNVVVDEIYSKLDQNRREFDTYLEEQAVINETLCGENCVGRWICKSGEVRANGIGWEVECVNTCPDNFLWEKGMPSVMAVAPGLYEVVYGVFAPTMPRVELLVNGDIVLRGGNQDGKVTRHPDGNLVGLSNIDFVALPARARVSLTYYGDPSPEAFLGLRKL